MGSPEKGSLSGLPSEDERRPTRRSTLTELQTRWEAQTKEAWLLPKGRLRDSTLIRRFEDGDKIKEAEPFHGIAFIKDGKIIASRWQAVGLIDPEAHAVLWPSWIPDEKAATYLASIPESRPFIFRSQLVTIDGVEKAIRFARHACGDYLPEEGERTLNTREMVAQIRRLLTAFARSHELTPEEIQVLNEETKDLIMSSGFDAARLPRVQEAVKRILKASTMRDRTERLNPTACRQILYSASIALTKELELKHTRVVIKYAELEAALRILRGQTRWRLSLVMKGLSQFLNSGVYRYPHLLKGMTKAKLENEKRGKIAYLRKVCEELETQIKVRPYLPVAQAVSLGLRGGKKEEYRKAGWRGDSAINLIGQGYFIGTARRIRFCIKRIDRTLEEYESIEKKEDEEPDPGSHPFPERTKKEH